MGKLLYGLLFVVLLPALLFAWARALDPLVQLPPVYSPLLGYPLAALGLALTLAGMAALARHGGGLPMNAFPPPRYVTRGAYALTPHPIYVGFCLACAGLAIALGSAPGLFIVTPVTALACAALVMGHERHDLRRRFGETPVAAAATFLRLPLAADDPDARPAVRDILSVYALVLLPWAIAYAAVAALGVPRDAVSLTLPAERGWPVLQWTEALYASAYPFVALAPLAAARRRDLRAFALAGLFALVVGLLCFLTLPVIAEPRPFHPTSPLGHLLAWERALDTPAAAFPSFHVAWALLAARAWASRGRAWSLLAWPFALAITARCATTGQHALADLAAGIALALLAMNAPAVWASLRAGTERLANSWREWHIGPVRVINHGLYAGLGAAAGVLIVAGLIGPRHLPAVALVALLSIVAGGLWGQFVEGSPRLLRPFGYYGNILGAALAAITVAPALGTPAWLLLASFAAAGPWVQALGRLRCLVQGCCHGHPAPPHIGIRYTHPRSRVCRIAALTDVPVHPTPLYSILANLAVGLLLHRLWAIAAPLSMILGAYLLLAGLTRFVEESYRGEPQTKITLGLPVYQWLAIASTLAGAILTIIPASLAPSPTPTHWLTYPIALFVALFTWAAMGIDFPQSNRRFSRLA